MVKKVYKMSWFKHILFKLCVILIKRKVWMVWMTKFKKKLYTHYNVWTYEDYQI